MNDQMEPINEEQVEEKEGVTRSCFEWAEALVSSIVIVIAIFTFLFRVVAVDGTSMETTLLDVHQQVTFHDTCTIRILFR